MKNEERNEPTLHELLCAYVLGETSPDEATRVEAELERSEELRAEHDRLVATIGLVRDTLADDEELSPSAHAELMERAGMTGRGTLRPEPPRDDVVRRPVFARPVLSAAAAAVLLAGGAWILVRATHETPAAGDPGDTVASIERGQRQQLDAGSVPDAARPAERQAPRALSATVDEVSEVVFEENEEPVPRSELLKALQGLGYDGGSESARDSAVAEPRDNRVADARQEREVTAFDVPGKKDAAKPAASAPAVSPDPNTAVVHGTGGGSGRSYGGVRLIGEHAEQPAAKATEGHDAGNALVARRELVPAEGERARTKASDDSDELRLGGAYEESRRQISADHVETLIQSCRRRPNESPSSMFFRFWGDNAFEYTIADALSTFSVDVDTASYALARNYLRRNAIPPKEAVRTEEFVNYFDADVPPPLEGDFRVHTDLAPSRFGGGDPNRWMMRVVVRGREVARDERQPLALTFVVDTSGSMRQENRMELVKHALRLLVGELDANDSIALVAFNNEARQVLPMTSAANRSTIEVAINSLTPNGSTNGEAGLHLGYATAADATVGAEGVSHRVVFLSDGVVNRGQTHQEKILADVAGFKARGIYLNTIGVGMGNHNDAFLEQLADKGDGLCNYVDSAAEAQRAIVENFTGAFQAIARDVKIQVEFDPAQVESYRLLGYENRAIRDVDFRNDAVDAGEIGAGHQVTALYELVRIPSGPDSAKPLATARLRWKAPHGANVEDPESATELAHDVRARDAAGSFAATSAGYRRAVLVAQFAEFLRRSVHARGDSLDAWLEEAAALATELGDDEFSELVQLGLQTRSRIVQGLTPGDELSLAVDALRRNNVLRARCEVLLLEETTRQKAEDVRLLEQIEKQNQELEDQIRELIRRQVEGSSDERALEEVGYLGDE